MGIVKTYLGMPTVEVGSFSFVVCDANNEVVITVPATATEEHFEVTFPVDCAIKLLHKLKLLEAAMLNRVSPGSHPEQFNGTLNSNKAGFISDIEAFRNLQNLGASAQYAQHLVENNKNDCQIKVGSRVKASSYITDTTELGTVISVITEDDSDLYEVVFDNPISDTIKRAIGKPEVIDQVVLTSGEIELI